MNGKYAVVRDSGRTLVITEELDPALDRQIIRRSSFADIASFYRNQLVLVSRTDGKKGKEPKQLGTYWLDAANRRQFDGVVFAPGRDVRGYYNLWRGFAVEPKQATGRCSRAASRDNICNGDERINRWVLTWMADAVQNPGERAEVAAPCVVRVAPARVYSRASSALSSGNISSTSLIADTSSEISTRTSKTAASCSRTKCSRPVANRPRAC